MSENINWIQKDEQCCDEPDHGNSEDWDFVVKDSEVHVYTTCKNCGVEERGVFDHREEQVKM